jgi:hypothetical protein
MDVKRYFLSEDNSRNLSKQLFNHLNVDDSKEKKEIHETLKKVMLGIWEKNKDKAEKHSAQKLMPYLNKKSIQYVLNGGVKQPSVSGKSIGQMQMDREKEVMGERRPKYQEQPQNDAMGERRQKYKEQSQSENGHKQIRQRQSNEPEIMESDGMGGIMGMSFAPFSSKINGEVIRADGRVGNHFQLNVNQNDCIDKGRSKKEMYDINEQKFAVMEQERNNQMDNNPYVKSRPKEINFNLDGGDSRVKDEYADNGKLEQNNGMDMISMSENSQMQQQIQQILQQQQMQMQPQQHMQQQQQQQPQQQQYTQQPQMQQQQVPEMQNEQMMFMIQQVIQQMLHAGTSEINNYSNIRNSLKTSIANKLDMDMNPQVIKDMSVDEISKYLAKKRKKFKQDSSDDDARSDNSSDSEKNNVKKIIKSKKENIEKQKGLEKFVDVQIKKKNKKVVDTESDSDSDSNKKKKKKSKRKENDSDSDKKNKKNKNKKKKIETESDTDSDSEKQISVKKKTKKDKKRKDSDSESEDEKPTKSLSQPTFIQATSISQTSPPPPILEIVKKRIVRDPPIIAKNAPEERIIIVKCNENESNPEYYNDYLVVFKEHYDKLIDEKYIKANKIILDKIDINLIPKITEKNNTFKLLLNGAYIDTSLKEGNYSLNKIIKAINDNLESERIIMENNDGFITVSNKDDKPFDINCVDNSIVKLLGFTEEKYTDGSKYTAEKRHAFNEDPIYLYVIDDVENGEKNPFAKINPDGTFKQLIFELKKKDIELLVIQFNTKDTNNWDKKDLVNLGEEPHALTFRFV